MFGLFLDNTVNIVNMGFLIRNEVKMEIQKKNKKINKVDKKENMK